MAPRLELAPDTASRRQVEDDAVIEALTEIIGHIEWFMRPDDEEANHDD